MGRVSSNAILAAKSSFRADAARDRDELRADLRARPNALNARPTPIATNAELRVATGYFTDTTTSGTLPRQHAEPDRR
jgi:hypothetical protein